MADIVKRLEASVRFDAINGDANERNVCKRQMVEAMAEINRLTRELAEAKAVMVSACAATDGFRRMGIAKELLYHRYFMANMQTQKGLNRLVKKCQRQKEQIRRLQDELAAREIN